MVGKRKGLCQRNVIFNKLLMSFLKASYTSLLTSKAHFPTSIWSNKSREASPPSMCLDHAIANEIYHFFHALLLKLAPTCLMKQCGTSTTQESDCRFVFYLPNKMFGIWGLLIPFQRYVTRLN